MSGTKPPESCIFGQFLNIGAFLLSVLFYIKYKQVLHILTSVKWIQYPIKVADFYPSHPRQKHLKKVNTISFGLGMVGALGVRFFWNFIQNHLKFIEDCKKECTFIAAWWVIFKRPQSPQFILLEQVCVLVLELSTSGYRYDWVFANIWESIKLFYLEEIEKTTRTNMEV